MKLIDDIKAAFKQGVDEEKQAIAQRRQKVQDLIILTDTLESLCGNRDINPPLKMAIRLMANGIDPQDFETIDRIGRAYAKGKYEFKFNPMKDETFQKELDTINAKEVQA